LFVEYSLVSLTEYQATNINYESINQFITHKAAVPEFWSQFVHFKYLCNLQTAHH